jgi:hypothetical protein
MLIVLLAIIGSNINAGTGYWICYAIYCVVYIIRLLFSIVKDLS